MAITRRVGWVRRAANALRAGAVIAIALCGSWAAAQGGDAIWATRGQNEPSAPPTIELPASRSNYGGHKRPISLKDIVSLRELQQPKISPDGSKVAFVVRQAFLGCNCYRSALYLTGTSPRREVKKLLEDDGISSLQWAPNGTHISFIAARGGTAQLWWVDVSTGTQEQLLAPGAGIASYSWSPGGQQIAFTVEAPRDSNKKLDVERYGFRYDIGQMRSEDLIAGNWLVGDRSVELWTFNLSSKSSQKHWITPRSSSARIGNITWAADGSALVFTYSRDSLNDALVMLPLGNGQNVKELPSPEGRVEAIQWEHDAQRIAILSRKATPAISTLSIVDIPAARLAIISREINVVGFPPFFKSDQRSGGYIVSMDGLGTDRQQAGLYRVLLNGQVQRLTSLENRIGDCDSAVRDVTVCILQAPSLAPRIALLNLRTAKVTPLVDPNPEVSALELSPVEHLRWTNDLGYETNGYLLMPRDAPSNKRIPLVIIAYGFNGEFITHAGPTLTSYPAQAFPRDGIAALLVNYPRYPGWEKPDFKHTEIAEGKSPLSSLKVIVQKLTEERNIDPCRVGFMGHSWGGFWVQYTISQSDLIRVAELHSGGTLVEPGTFWYMGHQAFIDMQKHLMVGGPYGGYLRNYERLSPSLNARNIRAPVLMQYGAMEARLIMEFYIALREHHVPVDFIVYPGAIHIFTQPSQRLASMRRTLDWFEFWLLDRENADPVDPLQYETWRELRKAESLARKPDPGLGPGLCKRQ